MELLFSKYFECAFATKKSNEENQRYLKMHIHIFQYVS